MCSLEPEADDHRILLASELWPFLNENCCLAFGIGLDSAWSVRLGSRALASDVRRSALLFESREPECELSIISYDPVAVHCTPCRLAIA